MKKFFNEFKEFAMRGNVLDMAIGVVLGSAFGKITTSLVNDVFMPLIGLVIGGIDLGKLDIILKPAVMNGDKEVTAAVTLGLGTFLTTIIDFILVAFVIFLMVKAINAFHKKKDEAPAPEEPAGPTTEELLTEIRDLLKESLFPYVFLFHLIPIRFIRLHTQNLHRPKTTNRIDRSEKHSYSQQYP